MIPKNEEHPLAAQGGAQSDSIRIASPDTSDTPLQANLARMASRAADDPAFYEIAGRTVQRMADDIKAGV